RLLAPEPHLGYGPAIRRRSGGSFRNAPGACRWRHPVRRRTCPDGLHDITGDAAVHRRRAGWLWSRGLFVQPGDRGVRQALSRPLPHDRNRCWHGGGLVRAVSLRAVRRRADPERRLAACAAHVLWATAPDRAYGDRACNAAKHRSQAWLKFRAKPVPDERARRGLRPPLLCAARVRLLHLLPPSPPHHAVSTV